MTHDRPTNISSDNQAISLWAAVKTDILPWIGAAILALLLFFITTVVLTGSVYANLNNTSNMTAILYGSGRLFYCALIALAVFLARRSRDMWTWIVTGWLILFFINQYSPTFTNILWSYSLLPAMTAMIGMLALGKVIEYIYARYLTEYDFPLLTKPALVCYLLLMILSTCLNSSIFYSLLSSQSNIF